jgi:hypothetical protein
MHHVFTWLEEHPAHRDALVADPLLRQRFVHESLRLHPASPVSLRHVLSDLTLRSGTELLAGEVVAIDLVAANRDPAVFGDDADEFRPGRPLPDDVAPWGLSFGHGVHACLGQELAGGIQPEVGPDGVTHVLLGAIAVLAGAVLEAGARPDPDDPAEVDTTTTRTVFAKYPVRYG